MAIKFPLALLGIGLFAVSPQPLVRAQGEQRVFVLEIHGRGALCAYTKESDWAKVPKEQDIEFIAIATSAGGVLKSILVQRFSEDTTRYDEYAIGGNGNVVQLKRTLDAIPDRVTAEQVWQVRAGKASKVSESWTQFKTNKPVPPDNDLAELLAAPIVMRVSEFPFSALVTDAHPEKWPDGMRCEKGGMDVLESKPRN